MHIDNYKKNFKYNLFATFSLRSNVFCAYKLLQFNEFISASFPQALENCRFTLLVHEHL